jgi:hypothetical protein
MGRQKDSEEEKDDSIKQKSKNNKSNISSYRLVVIMLSLLTLLVVMSLVMPLTVFLMSAKVPVDVTAVSRNLTEYAKWTIAVLLGAFGAWIGAGAAYFFGKENLQESSRSTETALRIQQEGFRRPSQSDRMKDMVLTTMNPNFIFDLEKNKKDVSDKLSDQFRGFWFVPLVDGITGELKDVIHAQLFWGSDFADDMKLGDIILKMDEKPERKKFHGDLFYIKVSPGDKITDVNKFLDQRKAEVAIVVDEKGKPTHCLTKTELRTLLKVND